MRPTFDTRALLFVNTVSTVHKGDIVVVDVPDIGLIVKRVKRINLENLDLSGDNPRSESSMCHVPINLRFLVGRVIASFNFPFRFKFY